MGCKNFFFAGGGTGGHIYPAIAVAEQIIKLEADAKIHLFVSTRSIDARILTQTGFEYTPLPAKGFSVRPGKLIGFCTSFLKSYRIAKRIIAESEKPIVIGIGGFVAAPVCFAAHKLKVPVKLLNVDIVPGRANKIIARWADEIFVQFEDTVEYFAKSKTSVNVVGCPLRSGFGNPKPDKVKSELGIDANKKTLLITGASSGSENINRAVCSLLKKLSGFANIGHKVLDYFDDMPDLLSAADLVVGRSGAVSVAEYAAAGVPSICMPYPYHKDRHQYLNAGKLVEAGAAVVVDDLPEYKETAEWLADELEELMKDEKKRKEMKEACRIVANTKAASTIAEKLLNLYKS